MATTGTPRVTDHASIRFTQRAGVPQTGVRTAWTEGYPVEIVGKVGYSDARFADVGSEPVVLLAGDGVIKTVLRASYETVRFVGERPDLVCECGVVRHDAANTSSCAMCGEDRWTLAEDSS